MKGMSAGDKAFQDAWKEIPKMKLLLLGATRLGGGRTLERALSNGAFSEVIAPTRKPLAPNERLVNPITSRLQELVAVLMSRKPDAIICALGTAQAKAGSKEAFHYVDYELPIAFGKAAHSVGVGTYAIVSAMGASPNSKSFYYKTRGEVERDIQEIGFRSLTIAGPALLSGSEMKQGLLRERR